MQTQSSGHYFVAAGRGFSFIEMLVAMLLMAMLLGIFGSLYRSTMAGSIQSDYQSNAQNFANTICQTLSIDLRQAVTFFSPATAEAPSFPITDLAIEPPAPAAAPIACSDTDLGTAGLNCGGSCGTSGTTLPHCVTFSLAQDPKADNYTIWYGLKNGVPVIYLEQVNPVTGRIDPLGIGRSVIFASDPGLSISNFEVRTLGTRAAIGVVVDDTSRYSSLRDGIPLKPMQLQHLPIVQSTFARSVYY